MYIYKPFHLKSNKLCVYIATLTVRKSALSAVSGMALTIIFWFSMLKKNKTNNNNNKKNLPSMLFLQLLTFADYRKIELRLSHTYITAFKVLSIKYVIPPALLAVLLVSETTN